MDSVVDGPMDLFDLEDSKVVVEAVEVAVVVVGMDMYWHRCKACRATIRMERRCMGSRFLEG